MKDKKGQNERGKPRSDDFKIGEIRVFSNRGPDAEDRLRRLFALIIRYAAGDGQEAPENDSPTGARLADDTTEAKS